MSANEITFHHYPPELFDLLVDAIPKLVKSKKDLLRFLKGAGVPVSFLNEWRIRVQRDASSVNKYEITRSVLEQLNDAGESMLTQRREIVKRVCEIETFTNSYENDRAVAKGLVADIRDVVNKKDSFTRMKEEREKELRKRREARTKELEEKAQLEQTRAALKDELCALFGATNPWKRGKDLESVLNRLFESYGILVKEDFTLKGNESEGIVEQIDGVIEFEGHLYFVEVKWLKERVGTDKIAPHLVRLMGRAESRGIFVSASGFADTAVTNARDFLQQKLILLCELEEIVVALENRLDLKDIFRKKAHEAQTDKNPLYVVRATSSLEV